MNINAIDQVIEQLEQITNWSIQQNSRIGYFTSLYLRVTKKIKEKIGTGYFDDDLRMEVLDANFAKRFLDAFEQFKSQDSNLPKAWSVALNATKDENLIILQQLLLSISAHINVDLGAAAAAIAPQEKIHALKGDFDKINELLASLVPVVIQEINELSPLIHLFTDLSGQVDDTIINFSLKTARKFSWQMALDLAPLSHQEKQPIINQRNIIIAELGEKIIQPGRFIEGIIKLVHNLESKDVDQIIYTLNRGNSLPENTMLWDLFKNKKTTSPNPPNHVYYFDIAQGQWKGTFSFKLKSWTKLLAAPIGLRNKVLVILMTLFQKIFGKSSVSSSIQKVSNQEGVELAKNELRIHKGFFTLLRSRGDYYLSPNGSSVKVDAHFYFGPITFLREHHIYPAVVWEKGFKATYHIQLLSSRFLGNYTVLKDKKQVTAVMENNWAVAEEILKKI